MSNLPDQGLFQQAACFLDHGCEFAFSLRLKAAANLIRCSIRNIWEGIAVIQRPLRLTAHRAAASIDRLRR